MSVFLSTPSARRATQGLEQYNRHNQNFYPRPLRGGRPSATAKYTASKNFYPRPLRGGRLLLVFEQAGLFVISIHALCEEGDVVLIGQFAGGVISIHALCEEGDVMDNAYQTLLGQFLSTPSARRATRDFDSTFILHDISIHALCEEGDAARCCALVNASDFYPRPLRGGRPSRIRWGLCPGSFLSTPSARRATSRFCATVPVNILSIHALCEEGDLSEAITIALAELFLSTPSARRATQFEWLRAGI